MKKLHENLASHDPQSRKLAISPATIMDFKVAVLSPGFAEGNSLLVSHSCDVKTPKRISRNKREAELKRLEDTISDVENQLSSSAAGVTGVEAKKLFDTQLAFLQSESFQSHCGFLIDKLSCSASYAVQSAIRHIIEIANDGGVDVRGSIPDWQAVEVALLRSLEGEKGVSLRNLTEARIIVSQCPTISEIQSADHSKILGWVVGTSSTASHVRLLLKDSAVPVVAFESIGMINEGDHLLIDGLNQTLSISPPDTTIEKFRHLRSAITSQEASVTLRQHPPITRDGITVHISGILNDPRSIRLLTTKGLDVGLFRSEYMFLGKPKKDWPNEDEQEEILSKVLETVGTGTVVVRTADLGADKWDAIFGELPGGMNSKMGLKSLKYALSEPLFFHSHLRSIIRSAAKYENLELKFPMVGDVSEFRQVKKIFLDEAQGLLDKKVFKRRPFIKIGAMIETPLAALGASKIAMEADFLSIGTNDLLQYCTASDRDVPQVNHSLLPYHPEFIKLLHYVVACGKKANKEIRVCGEMASHRTYLPLLLGLGITHLSVSHDDAPKINAKLPEMDTELCSKLVRKVMRAHTPEEAAELLRDFHGSSFDESQ